MTENLENLENLEPRTYVRFRNQFTARPEQQGEVNTQPSKTVPDQSMTVRELLERNKRGLPLSGHKHPIYNGDTEDYPDLRKLDLSEIAALRDSVQEEIENHRKDLKEQNEKIQKAEAERHKLELFRQWKEEENQKSQKPII